MRYDLKEIGEMFGVHRRTVRKWVADGELKAINVSRSRKSKKPRWRVTETQLQAFLASRTAAGEAPAPQRPKRQPQASVRRFF